MSEVSHIRDLELSALETWGHLRGARSATLQVVIGNASAQRLYASRGYELVYQYHYLRAPNGAAAGRSPV